MSAFNQHDLGLVLSQIFCACFGEDHVLFEAEVAVTRHGQPGLDGEDLADFQLQVGGVAVFLPERTQQGAAIMSYATELMAERVG